MSAPPPLRAFRAIVEYDGTDFFGWQVQPGRRTVQGVIEDAIERITGQRVRVMGAGRTDRGVHAAGQVAGFELATAIAPRELARGVNALLPDDVGLVGFAEVAPGFSARGDALARRYLYRIARRRSPLERRRAWELWAPLDLELMRRAGGALLGEHDMRSFSVEHPPEKSPLVRLERIEWRVEGPIWLAEFEANRFLRGMVRRLVGSLVDVGRGRWREEDLAAALDARDARRGGPSAPARGLTLLAVRYPDSLEDGPKSRDSYRDIN